MLKDFFDGACRLCVGLNKMVRPYLTFFITTLFNVMLAWALLVGKLDIEKYITALAPMNAMILGFWFGEKSALKTPGVPGNDHEDGEQDAKPTA